MHFLGRILLKALFPVNVSQLPYGGEPELLKARFGFGKYILTLVAAAFGMVLFFTYAEKIYHAIDRQWHPAEKNGSLFLYDNSGWTWIGLLFPVYCMLVVFLLKRILKSDYEPFKTYCMSISGFHIPKMVKTTSVVVFLAGLGFTLSSNSETLEAGKNGLISTNWMENEKGDKLSRTYPYKDVAAITSASDSDGVSNKRYILVMNNGDFTELRSSDFNHDDQFRKKFMARISEQAHLNTIMEDTTAE